MTSQTPSDVKNEERHKNGGIDNGGVRWSGVGCAFVQNLIVGARMYV